MCHPQDCQAGESGGIKSYLKGFHMRSYSQLFESPYISCRAAPC